MPRNEPKRGVGLTLIAVGKLILVLLVLAAGAAALIFANRVPPEVLREWADAFQPESEWVQQLLDKLTALSGEKLAFIGRTSIAYACLFAVEGIGLWRNKRWAHYLTAIVTASLMPFELHALIREFDVAKLIALIINGAVVVYLTVRIVRDRRQTKAARS